MSVRRRVVLATSLLAMALATAYFFTKGGGSEGTEPEQAGAGDAAEAVEAAASANPDCVYTMVPGGVFSAEQVREAIARDAVVAAHFKAVDLELLREANAGAARRVYVSYRVRDEVYWSQERVELEPGEKILTDGRNEIRARCGNLVSDGAQLTADETATLPALYNLKLDAIETGSSSTPNAAAAGGDPIAPVGSGDIVLPAPDPAPVNPGPGGGGGGTSPSLTVPWVLVPGGNSGGSPGGGSSDGSNGGGGGGIGGGGGGGGGIGGGAGTGGSGGIGSGDAAGGGIDSGRSGEGSGTGDGGSGGGGTNGSAGGGGGNPGGGAGSDESGSTGGGGSSTPNSDFVGPTTENPGGPGSGGPGNEDVATLVDQSGDNKEPETVRVPEPATLSLLAIGIGAAALSRRRRTGQQ